MRCGGARLRQSPAFALSESPERRARHGGVQHSRLPRRADWGPRQHLTPVERSVSQVPLEDADADPDSARWESTLDTLYFTAGGTAPYGRPLMTYYHGFESP